MALYSQLDSRIKTMKVSRKLAALNKKWYISLWEVNTDYGANLAIILIFMAAIYHGFTYALG